MSYQVPLTGAHELANAKIKYDCTPNIRQMLLVSEKAGHWYLQKIILWNNVVSAEV